MKLSIGKQAREIRQRLGLTQTQVARRIKNTQRLLTRIENDEGDPRLSTLEKIARGLNCEIEIKFVPVSMSESSVEQLALEKAHELVMMSVANAAIELQRPSDHVIREEIERIKNDILINHRDLLIRKVAEKEGEYGETQIDDISDLKIERLQNRRELYEAEFKNINQAVEKYFFLTESEPFELSYSFMMQVHSDMFSDVWGWAGKIRSRDLNLGIKHFQIRSELQKLIKDFEDWKSRNWNPIDISARLHHRLVWIHPFQNGNGRWARLITNIYLKGSRQKMILWPEDQMYIQSDFRKKYIHAIQQADQGDYSGMIQIHKEYQEK